MLKLDHIAIATDDLATGAAWLEDRLGVALEPGGHHAAMGTWNRLLSLGPEEYLEIIAIEPGAPGPSQPRWFDLDRFKGPTRPTTRICQTDRLDDTLTAAPRGTGVPWDLERGDLRWRMAIPQDGRLPFDGLFPALIEWRGPAHPAPRLPDRGVRLIGLHLALPEADDLQRALSPMIRDARLEITPAEVPSMEVTFATPRGEIRI